MVLSLGPALAASCPPEWHVTQGVEVRISRFRSLTPDLLVVTAEAATEEPSRFHPHEVVLAVEIVSRTSKAMDRITKPALYAQAGISCFWRVETDGEIVVHTHRLDPAAELYVPTGAFDKLVEVDEPWQIRLPIQDITPRFYRTGA